MSAIAKEVDPSKYPKRYPNLSKALESGLVKREGSDYVGTASDGQTVAVGSIWSPETTEMYLTNCPTPDYW